VIRGCYECSRKKVAGKDGEKAGRTIRERASEGRASMGNR